MAKKVEFKNGEPKDKDEDDEDKNFFDRFIERCKNIRRNKEWD